MTGSDAKSLDSVGTQIGEKRKTQYNPMTDGVRWSERYALRIEKIWKFVPNWLAHILATIAIFLLASGIQGIYKVD